MDLIHSFSHTSSSFILKVAPISSTDTVKFNDNITLKDVICVSIFNLNLMSVSKITNSLNCCVVFTLHGCVLQDLATWRMICSVNNTQAYTTCPLFQTKLTHLKFRPRFMKRLRHPFSMSLQLASSLLPPISKNLITIHNNCSICPKATRLPFPLSTIKFHSPYNLLHCDT